MIPEFPQFKSLELSDKEEVEKITQKFPPYGDFNFSNMWAWDLRKEMGVSILNNNLVVKFTDYINGTPFFSFLGENKVNETVEELITFSEKNHKIGVLKLIPEVVVNFLNKSKFDAVSDRDSYDYIYSISHMASMDVWPHSSISKGIRQFIKKYPDYIIKQNSIKEISKNEYIKIFEKWSNNKNITNHLELNEYKSFERILQIKDKNIKIVSLYVKNILIGFSLFEIINNDYALSHFAKADISYHQAVYDVLDWEEAKILKNQGMKYYNWEQDLGIQGLKKAKMKYKPELFLNKFFIKKHK